jgi:hypothetical protein
MSNSRKRYHEYLYDDSKAIPRRSKYRQLQLQKPQETDFTPVTASCSADGQNQEVSASIPFEIVSERAENDPLNTNSNRFATGKEDSNEDDDYLASFSELTKTFTNEEEAACAYLTSFYCGRMTQKSLKIQLKLNNAELGKFKLPSSFKGLLRIVMKDAKRQKEFNKVWFCSTCQMEVQLESQYQRACTKCNTK